MPVIAPGSLPPGGGCVRSLSSSRSIRSVDGACRCAPGRGGLPRGKVSHRHTGAHCRAPTWISKIRRTLVGHGYDALSLHYERASGCEAKYACWSEELLGRDPWFEHGPRRGGCGTGVLVARALPCGRPPSHGIDISEVRIEEAREPVPQAEFIQADATTLAFPAQTFTRSSRCMHSAISRSRNRACCRTGSPPGYAGYSRVGGSWPPLATGHGSARTRTGSGVHATPMSGTPSRPPTRRSRPSPAPRPPEAARARKRTTRSPGCCPVRPDGRPAGVAEPLGSRLGCGSWPSQGRLLPSTTLSHARRPSGPQQQPRGNVTPAGPSITSGSPRPKPENSHPSHARSTPTHNSGRNTASCGSTATVWRNALPSMPPPSTNSPSKTGHYRIKPSNTVQLLRHSTGRNAAARWPGLPTLRPRPK
ncbi:class I SAM-dependent methyltransferase [Embleya sp. NPDC020886]|uniref:class I SAM-dependent methyltransferase n=1 Tax=Embleya sp. NPDC020886 TaxID=3363980 RepID=UPI0037A743C8